MDATTFLELIKEHHKKLQDAFLKLSDKDWQWIGEDLERFLERAGEVYHIPKTVLLRELGAVEKNIKEGSEGDCLPYLDPTE